MVASVQTFCHAQAEMDKICKMQKVCKYDFYLVSFPPLVPQSILAPSAYCLTNWQWQGRIQEHGSHWSTSYIQQ